MVRSLLFVLALGLCSSVLPGNSAAADEVVRYRLDDWKRKHIHDTAKAERIADTLVKLGCEVEKLEHNGHIDVKYRCPQWRQITLDTHDEAVRWQRWFREYYFQTEHKH